MTNRPFDNADCQRAASLLAHHARQDADGIALLVNDAIEDDRVPELICSMLAVLGRVVPEVRSAEAAEDMTAVANAFAERALGGPR